MKFFYLFLLFFNKMTPKRPNFLRRTKATTAGDVTETDVTTTESPGKFTRRPLVKSRKESGQTESAKSAGTAENRRRPSLSGAGARSERPARNFVRRRLGGANVTTTTTQSTLPSSSITRRPFRVASRRRPVGTTSTTTTAATTVATTTERHSEEVSQEIEDVDVIEVTTTPEQPSALKSTKIQRRPLLLKEADQNPSATNEAERKRQSKIPSTSEEDKKRQSKKYSASFKQNQLDEVLRQKAKSQEEVDVTTEGRTTTVDDYNAETALAIAAYQLLTAPLPIVNNFDEPKPTKKSTTTPKTDFSTVYTEPSTVYSSPNYESSRTTVNSVSSTTIYPSTITSKVSRPSGFTTPGLPTTAFFKPTSDGFSKPTINAELTDYSRGRTLSNSDASRLLIQGLSQGLASSTARYLGTNEKLIPVPVEDYSFATGGYSGGQEPSYFTREYLLESPVTKTYDDEYQYLSPSTTPQTSTRKIPKKTVYRKISTTHAPTEPPYVPIVTSPVPRRAPKKPQNVPFEKVKKVTKYRPQDNYDYYDDGDVKVVQKYAEGTKVVLHAKGVIECLDIGNFPHPTSCKKFISCARIENGSNLGWEYICPKGLSFDPVGGICNWSAGLGCDEKDV